MTTSLRLESAKGVSREELDNGTGHTNLVFQITLGTAKRGVVFNEREVDYKDSGGLQRGALLRERWFTKRAVVYKDSGITRERWITKVHY